MSSPPKPLFNESAGKVGRPTTLHREVFAFLSDGSCSPVGCQARPPLPSRHSLPPGRVPKQSHHRNGLQCCAGPIVLAKLIGKKRNCRRRARSAPIIPPRALIPRARRMARPPAGSSFVARQYDTWVLSQKRLVLPSPRRIPTCAISWCSRDREGRPLMMIYVTVAYSEWAPAQLGEAL
ncbi:hypothetical protein BV20DRAFT_603737 [Pilatotrama ljubarskyi]|nr:hypothetical protein BV20DRAFT_603737 [Pilatotrama ljubarskyi]